MDSKQIDTVLHKRVASFLQEGYCVIYAVERDVNRALINLAKLDDLIEDYVQAETLRIIDAEDFYSSLSAESDYETVLAQWQKVISSLPIENRKKLVIFGKPISGPFTDKYASQLGLVEYEERAASQTRGAPQAFCCYDKQFIERLPFDLLVRLLKAHQNAHIVQYDRMNCNGIGFGSNAINSIEIAELVEQGLTEALGEETAKLVLKTLRLVYKIKEQDTTSDPALFESKIMKLFGEAGKPILKRITTAVINDMFRLYY